MSFYLIFVLLGKKGVINPITCESFCKVVIACFAHVEPSDYRMFKPNRLVLDSHLFPVSLQWQHCIIDAVTVD